MIDKFADLAASFGNNVVADAADANIIVGKPRATDLFHQVIDGFPLSERVHERRHSADVLAESTDGDQMAGDAIELAGNHATKLAAPRHFGSSELFRGHAERLIGEHRC